MKPRRVMLMIEVETAAPIKLIEKAASNDGFIADIRMESTSVYWRHDQDRRGGARDTAGDGDGEVLQGGAEIIGGIMLEKAIENLENHCKECRIGKALHILNDPFAATPEEKPAEPIKPEKTRTKPTKTKLHSNALSQHEKMRHSA
jgi:hypothetical protein